MNWDAALQWGEIVRKIKTQMHTDPSRTEKREHMYDQLFHAYIPKLVCYWRATVIRQQPDSLFYGLEISRKILYIAHVLY